MSDIDEIWKPIIGFENLYEVSNLGRVRRLKSVVHYYDPRWGKWIDRPTKGGIMRQYKGKYTKSRNYPSVDRYLFVPLCKDGKYTNKYVHRMVAEAFISNPCNKPEVNHKDRDIFNNHVENLE